MRKPILPIRTLDDQLIRDEGWRNEAYPDPITGGAPWTIGVGHTGPEVTQGTVWSDDRIQAEFNIDIREASMALRKAFPWTDTLDHIRREALVNMVFNLGIKRFSGFKKMLKALELFQYGIAAQEGMDSLWAKQVGDRAKRLTNQIRDGIWY